MGRLWGSIGLNSDETKQDWSNEDAQMLRMVGEMIYNCLSRVQTEAELRDSEALYAGIFAHAAESIFLLDIAANGELIHRTINPTNEQLFQMSRSDVIGKSLSEVRSPQLTSDFMQKFQQCINSKQPINYEESISLPEGTYKFLTTLVPIADSVILRVKTISEIHNGGTHQRDPFQIQPPDPQTPDRLIFEVVDTGLGIAPEEVNALFDAFVQSQSGKQSNEGTGLGLAISQQFVKLMGGAIAVESTLGKGTVFRFDIQFQPVVGNELQDLLAQREI